MFHVTDSSLHVARDTLIVSSLWPNNAKIKYVLETHFHADFVSGHVDLAEKTGATIVFGPGAQTEYNIHSATDGPMFSMVRIGMS